MSGSILDAVDSLYDDVTERILTGIVYKPDGVTIDTTRSIYNGATLAPINANRQFGGFVAAEEWPPKDVSAGKLYLVEIGKQPMRQGTPANPLYRFLLQWCWVEQGVDLPENATEGLNRGNRRTLDSSVEDELIAAHFPQFAWLFNYSSTEIGTLARTPYNPPQSFQWSALHIGPKQSLETGTLYGAAGVSVLGFLQPLSQ
jgi:hypothetical protein